VRWRRKRYGWCGRRRFPDDGYARHAVVHSGAVAVPSAWVGAGFWRVSVVEAADGLGSGGVGELGTNRCEKKLWLVPVRGCDPFAVGWRVVSNRVKWGGVGVAMRAGREKVSVPKK